MKNVASSDTTVATSGVWMVARLASAASNSAIGMLHVSYTIAGAAFTLFESKLKVKYSVH